MLVKVGDLKQHKFQRVLLKQRRIMQMRSGATQPKRSQCLLKPYIQQTLWQNACDVPHL